MSKKIKEITDEKLSAAIDYAYTLNKKMNANVLTLKIVLPLGSVLLALHAIVLFLGVIYVLVPNDTVNVIAFNQFEFITRYWNDVFGICCSISDLVYVQVILMILYLFIVPFVISSIAALMIFCTTKGKKTAIEGNNAQRAKQLYAYLDQSPQTYFEAYDGKPVLWRRISGIVSGILVIVFMLYYFGSKENQSNDFLSAVSVLFQSDQYTEDILLCIVWGVLFYVPYTIVHYMFTVMIQPYCDSYKKWKKFIDEVERYWLSVDKNEREERARKEKEREQRKLASRSDSSSSSYRAPGLSFAQKMDYINRNFGGVYSFSAIQYIESDPSLSPSEKEELIIFLRAYGE